MPSHCSRREERTALLSLAENTAGANDLVRDVSVAVDDERRQGMIGVVLNALVANDGDEFGARELGSE